MKRLVILLAVILSANVMMAQKMDRTNAYNYNRNGQYDKAAESIEKCVHHESFLGMKPKDQAQAWLYAGTIYLNIYKSPEYAPKYPDALEKAYNALDNCIKADPTFIQDAQNASEVYSRIAVIAVNYFQDGVDNFNNQDYVKAASSFRKSYEISLNGANPDTSALINTALSYKNGGMYEAALTNYEELKNLGYTQVDLYKNMASCYLSMNDDEKSLEMIQAGLEKYPSDASMIIEKVNLYLKQGRGEEALADLNKLHEMDPNNTSILFTLGTIFGDDTHAIYDPEKAIEYYSKALEINPQFTDAGYNLAALYINMSNKKKAAANELGFSKEEQEQYGVLMKEAEDLLREGLPFAKAAYEAQPSEEMKRALKSIYVNLNMLEEAKALEAE